MTHPAWTIDHDNPTHTLTVGSGRADLAKGQAMPGRYVVGYQDPAGTAARQFAEAFELWLDEIASDELSLATTAAHELVRAIEELVHDIDLATQENAVLRARLHEAHIEINFLRRQLGQVTEALCTNRPSVVKTMLKGVAAILTASIASGAGVATTETLNEPDQQSIDTTSAFIERCTELVTHLDALNTPNDTWSEDNQVLIERGSS